MCAAACILHITRVKCLWALTFVLICLSNGLAEFSDFIVRIRVLRWSCVCVFSVAFQCILVSCYVYYAKNNFLLPSTYTRSTHSEWQRGGDEKASDARAHICNFQFVFLFVFVGNFIGIRLPLFCFMFDEMLSAGTHTSSRIPFFDIHFARHNIYSAAV